MCKICLNGFTMNDQNECNAPYTLVKNNKCELCKEGTYFDKGSCESISFLK